MLRALRRAQPGGPRRRRRGLGVAALLVLALGCAETVQHRATAAMKARTEPIRRVAVAPFTASYGFRNAVRPEGALSREGVLELVTHQVSEALTRRGVDVVTADAVARALGPAPADGRPVPPVQVARAAAEQFGADAVLIGQVLRYEERQGSGAGSRSPAAVGFEVTLHAAPGGERLWQGTFDERQKPLGENVLTTAQYPGGGTRWLTAEELLRWGAQQTVRSMPLGP